MSIRPTPCLADHPVHLAHVAASNHTWELHIGTVQLFISGPGPDAWLACSEPCYSGSIGTDHERHVAHKAVTILRKNHGQNKDAGIPEIQTALALARAEIPAPKTDVPCPL
jgi:hypothetical protein